MGIKDIFAKAEDTVKDSTSAAVDGAKIVYGALTDDPYGNFKEGVKSIRNGDVKLPDFIKGGSFSKYDRDEDKPFTKKVQPVLESALDDHSSTDEKPTQSTQPDRDGVNVNGVTVSHSEVVDGIKKRSIYQRTAGTKSPSAGVRDPALNQNSIDVNVNNAIFRKTMATGVLATKLAQKDGMSSADACDVGNAVSAYTSQLVMFDSTLKGTELSEATRNLADRVSRQYGVDAAVIKDSYDKSTELLRDANVIDSHAPRAAYEILQREPDSERSMALSALSDTRMFMSDNEDLIKADSTTIGDMGYHNAADVTATVISQTAGYEPAAADVSQGMDVAE